MSNLLECSTAFRVLYDDGLFVEIVNLSETEMEVIATTYMTDTDSENLDCLRVAPETPHVANGPCGVCESFTLGLNAVQVPGSIQCPFCNRQTKPWSVIPRVKTATFSITPKGLILQPGVMQPEMAEKIISAYHVVFYSQRAQLDLDDGPNPRLVVFDLDHTLWDFDCGKDVIAPFLLYQSEVIDYMGRPAGPFPDVPGIIGALIDAGIQVAFASRNQAAPWLEDLLRAIPLACKSRPEIQSLWDAIPRRSFFQAYSSNGLAGKTRHFRALTMFSNIPYSQMLFFDDFTDNTVPAEAMGITSVLVKEGMTWEVMNSGLRKWRGMQLDLPPFEHEGEEPTPEEILAGV